MQRVIESNKVRKDLSAKLYSDLHYVPEDDLSFLKRSVNNVESEKPEYIFFLGDLLDESNFSISDLKMLFDLLARMAKVSKVILVLGNHDQLTRDSKGQWTEHYNPELINALKNIGIHVLENEAYEDDNIYAFGTRFSGSYYEKKEPARPFIETIKDIQYADTEKFNLLLEHSPKHTFDGQFISLFDNLQELDLTLGGHYHNACVPWYLDKILPGNRGLIDPYNNLFPSNARGVKKITKNNYGIIASPLTTFSSNTKFRKINDIFYPSVEQNILIKKK